MFESKLDPTNAKHIQYPPAFNFLYIPSLHRFQTPIDPKPLTPSLPGPTCPIRPNYQSINSNQQKLKPFSTQEQTKQKSFHRGFRAKICVGFRVFRFTI